MTALSTGARSRPMFLLLLIVILSLLCLTLLPASGNASEDSDDASVTVGLVNEDTGGRFNGTDYAFGASFVDRVSRDSDYNWIVMSRSVAEKAYGDGSLDAILYIPQSFTNDILTLQELRPTKATVEYKLQPQEDARADQLLESEVSAIVHGFNQSVIRVYFASVADGMAEADKYMHATLGNQEALIAALTTQVQEPLSQTVPGIEGFASSATSLKEANAASVQAHNLFSESVTNALTTSSSTLSDQLPVIDEYASRQKEIAQANLDTSNRTITGQAASDLDFYGKQFDQFKTSMMCKLSGTDVDDQSAACTLTDGTILPSLGQGIAALNQAVVEYTENHAQATGALYTNLNQRIEGLKALEALLTATPEPEPDPDPEPDPEPDPGPETEPTSATDPDPDPEPEPEPPGPDNPIDPAIITGLQNEILALESLRDSLSTDIPTLDLGSEVDNLSIWHTDAVSAVKGSALGASTTTSLNIADWTAYAPGSDSLYVDNSNGLHDSVAGLVSQSAQVSGEIARGAAEVPDNSSQFDALLRSATATSSGAESATVGLDDLMAAGGSGLEEYQSFYANFSTILANTRTQGVDASGIYDFFSSPIGAKNITPGSAGAVSTVAPSSRLDLKWAGVFAGGLGAGFLFTVVGGALLKKRRSAPADVARRPV